MSFHSSSFADESRRQEISDKGYLILTSSSTDFHALRGRDPMILDAGVVVFVCLGGSGRIAVDMHTVHVQRGSFVLLLPYSVVQVVEVSDDIDISLVATGFGFLDRLVMHQPVENYVARIREHPDLLLSEAQLEEISRVYRFVEGRYAGASGPLTKEIQNTLMTYLALEIVSLYGTSQPVARRKLSRYEQVFRNFTLSLSKHFKEQRTVEFYATEACLTPKHFSAIIKERSGKLPSEWITERTTLLIKFLLDNSDLSVKQICDELNFANQSFFTRYFKNQTGTTPTAYRNRP